MKRFLLIVTIPLLSYNSIAQVGINNTDPKASLDISASNKAAPSNTDGLLIPRIDDFPSSDPEAAQQGMMVYLTTTSGSNPPGFYYWDNTSSKWKIAVGTDGKGWYKRGTTTIPNSIYDNIYTMGNVTIGTNGTPPSSSLYIRSTFEGAGINLNKYHANTTSYPNYGIFSFTDLQAGSTGMYSNIGSTVQSIPNVSGNIYNFNASNKVKSGSSANSHILYYGIFANNQGSNLNAKRYGSYIEYSINTTSIGNKYGHYTKIPDAVPGTHFGFYSDVVSTSGYAAYFLGRVSVGATTSDNYIFPTSRGLNGQIISTDGSGNLSWVTPTAGTDDQNISGSGLLGTNLTIGIENGSNQVIDLSSLQDGTGTDDQNLTNATLTGNTLSIAIENGTGTNVDLSPLQDADWHETGGTIPNSINDNIYTQGNVGIGTTTPDYNLSVGGVANLNEDITSGIALRVNGDEAIWYNGSVFSWGFGGITNYFADKVGISTSSPDTKLHLIHRDNSSLGGFKIENSNVSGNYWRLYVASSSGEFRFYSSTNGNALTAKINGVSGAYTAVSDRRLKTDFKSLYFDWNDFMSLKPLTYLFKSQKDDKKHIGFVAQDVLKIYPELVSYTVDENLYHLDYSATGIVAIKAVQELKLEVEQLKSENQKLKERLSKYEALEKRISLLENNSEIVGN